jgi:prophage regulatory protein
MRTLTKAEVCDRLGIALSTLNNKIDPKSRWYDPSFPERIMIGPRAVRFSEEQLTAWIDQRSSRSSRSSPTRRQRPEVGTMGEEAPVVGLPDEGGSAEPSVHPPVVEARNPKAAKTRPASTSLSEEEPLSASEEAAALNASEADLPTGVSGVIVKELHIDSPPDLSLWDWMQLHRDTTSKLHPDWAFSINSILKSIAGGGTTVSQSGGLSRAEIHDLLNPSDEVLSALDGIDLHSYSTHGVFLTAVLYDAPDQCKRLVRLAEAVGVRIPVSDLLRLHRERLFELYEPDSSRGGRGVPTWRQFDDRWRIVREWRTV